MSIFDPAEPWLARVRAEAQDAVNARDHAKLWELADELRTDSALWTTVWAPAVAIAARGLGRSAARQLLDAAVDAGFCQPEALEPHLSEAFGADPDWESLLERMRRNIPPPPVTLRRWPRRGFGPDVGWYRLAADREPELRRRIPRPRASAWDTTVALLAWTRRQWRHANDHAAEPDAVTILDAVATGQRFACVEYAVVLAQALNAVGIPARRLTGYRGDYHHGTNRAHEVVEAWIDEPGSWVALDPQNGMYWAVDDGTPAAPAELRRRLRAGEPRPAHVRVGATPMATAEAADWWQYYRFLRSTGTATIAWETEFVPHFQNDYSRQTDILVTEPGPVYPDLSELDTSIVNGDDGPALRFTPTHPYTIGTAITHGTATRNFGLAETWTPSEPEPGDHRVEVATRTPYATLTPHILEFTKQHDHA